MRYGLLHTCNPKSSFLSEPAVYLLSSCKNQAPPPPPAKKKVSAQIPRQRQRRRQARPSCFPPSTGGIQASSYRNIVSPYTQRLHSSSCWGFPYSILNLNPNKELLWSLRYNGGIQEHGQKCFPGSTRLGFGGGGGFKHFEARRRQCDLALRRTGAPDASCENKPTIIERPQ